MNKLQLFILSQSLGKNQMQNIYFPAQILCFLKYICYWSPRKRRHFNNRKWQKISLKAYILDFSGGAVDRNLPANARGNRFDPCSGKIPHTAEQLSHVPQLLKRAYLELAVCHKRCQCTSMKSSPCSPQLQKVHAKQQRPQCSQKYVFKRHMYTYICVCIHTILNVGPCHGLLSKLDEIMDSFSAKCSKFIHNVNI